MNYYSNEKEEVLLHFKSGEEGLSSEEAAKRLEETGRKYGVIKKYFNLFLNIDKI